MGGAILSAIVDAIIAACRAGKLTQEDEAEIRKQSRRLQEEVFTEIERIKLAQKDREKRENAALKEE